MTLPTSTRHQDLYLIGEVSRLGGISQRALRHYDSLKLIKPDYIGENNYRYYSLMTILRIPVINYLKKMGFSLEDIAKIFESGEFSTIRERFRTSAEECERELLELTERREIIRDWTDLIDEANSVKAQNNASVSVKFCPAQNLISMPYEFWGNYADATINLGFTSFVESVHNVISGPVIMQQPNWQDCLEPFTTTPAPGSPTDTADKNVPKQTRDVLILQKALRPCDPSTGFVWEGGMYLSTYHVGPHEELYQAYQRVAAYAEQNKLQIAGPAYERFVTDYWTSYDPGLFVTELLLPLVRV